MKFGLPAPECWDYGCALPHLASSYAGVEPRGLCVPIMYSVYMTLSARVVSSICMLGKITWDAILIRVYVSIYVCTLFSTMSDDLCVDSSFLRIVQALLFCRGFQSG